ncbi:hypothetical protein ABZ540_12235 [Nocardia xishanensis]|uniref:hypothetical protein n=1 Tax=Nocardia xishanensis TaxID=238964 RepID=UPI0033DBE814
MSAEDHFEVGFVAKPGGGTARYDESSADRVEPSVVHAAVEVLAGLAGGGRALEQKSP